MYLFAVTAILVALGGFYISVRQQQQVNAIDTAKYRANQAETRAQQETHKESDQLIADGQELAGRGRLTDAIAKYDAAIQLNPDSEIAYSLRGYALYRRSMIPTARKPADLQDAIQSLEKAQNLNPNYVWSAYNLALAYWADGKKDLAVDAVARVLATKPDFRGIIAHDVQFKAFRSSSRFQTLMKGSHVAAAAPN